MTDKAQVTFVEYSREIAPLVRDLLKKKEIFKDFKDSDAKALELKQNIKDAQELLKKYLAENDEAKDLVGDVKDVAKEVKLAVKGAARGTEYKPADLTGFFVARAKASVKKTITKGGLFVELEGKLV